MMMAEWNRVMKIQLKNERLGCLFVNSKAV